MKDWTQYEKVGQTRDDAVGEAYDKVARLLGIPYPGGPEVAKLAEEARAKNFPQFAELTPPMLNSDDLDFSFSGLKTAVRYAVTDKEMSHYDKAGLCRDFEDAVKTVLVKKTLKAIEAYNIQTVIVGGGVSANYHLKQTIEQAVFSYDEDIVTYFPQPGLSTDNSIMIALAGHARKDSALLPTGTDVLRADGNKTLA
jgi:N6-L-threonylcarbamoyladenine synthase